jgi:hypothetical protein
MDLSKPAESRRVKQGRMIKAEVERKPKKLLFYNRRDELKERRYGRNSPRCDGRG